jgi:cytochrome bd ubiquinol oxidase subunit II
MTDLLAGHPILPVIWACIMAFVILAYVTLDGFDLGVGMLFPVEPDPHDRDVMVNTIAPVWDGNETWLVLGGSGLYGAFPAAYSVILPSIYPLVILMLMGLIFRGVAFEFRFRAIESERHWWDWAFFGGSVAAAFCQGAILGALIQGTKVVNFQFAGGAFDWLTPFTIFCGIAVVFGYALLGASWLLWRTTGKLHAHMRRYTFILGIVMLAMLLIVSAWTGLLNPHFTQRWFAWPGILASAVAPILSAVLAVIFFRGLARDESDSHDKVPFFCALGWFVLGFLGLGYSIFPMIVPPSLDIWQAASVHSSQVFLLVGAVVMIPLILGYNALSYYIFRGKVEPGAHYH